MANISFDWRSWRSITTAAVVAVLMAACGGGKESGGSTSVVESTKAITVADAVDTSGKDSDYSELLDGPALAGVLKVKGAKVGVAAVPDNTLRIHYQRSDAAYTGWTLYAYDQAANTTKLVGNWPGVATTGEDAFGKYWDVPLATTTKVNFILVKGATADSGGTAREPSEWTGKTGTDEQQYFDTAAGKEIWKVAGDAKNYTSLPVPANTLRIHYKRTNADYGDYTTDGAYWGVHAWDKGVDPGWNTPYKKAGEDAFGVFFDVPINMSYTTNNTIGYKFHKGGAEDHNGAGQSFDFDGSINEIWRTQDDSTTLTSDPNKPPVSDLDYVRIHYKRFNADYTTWGLHLFGDVDMSKLPTYVNPENAAETKWGTPLPLVSPGDSVATGTDAFGVYIDVPVKKPSAGGKTLKFIVHGLTGDAQGTKDGGDHVVTMSIGQEVWMVEGGEPVYTLEEANKVSFSLNDAKAFWISKDLILWPRVEASGTYKLYSSNRYFNINSDTGAVTGTVKAKLGLTVVDAATLTEEQKARYAYIPTPYQVLKVTGSEDEIKLALRTQLAVVREEAGKVVNATALQIAGALDDLYAANAKNEKLGVILADGETTFKLWAPTALQASVAIYDNGVTGGAASVKAMTFDDATGIWSVVDATDLTGKYYKFIADVHVRGVGLVRNKVTDPYSVSLSTNSKRSYIADLASTDASLMPAGWADHTRPVLAAQEDMSVYEMHVRDFSASDMTVTESNRGKFLAFTEGNSNGMLHLKALAAAGLTDVHLMPVYDMATIPETGCTTPNLYLPADRGSEVPQAIIDKTKETDCYNWGYDPYHFTALEGSYASNPADGAVRVLEFRKAVKALHEAGLRVGMDLVYNHTTAAGQDPKSVLDRLVPGYYQRLNANGAVENSSCCANTATENKMMAKLMIDSVVTLSKAYKLDSFRFDLMGHQPRAVMEDLKAAVDTATGRNIFIFGEGWNFGEVKNGKRFVQASQLSLADSTSGIGTFSDRARDAARGGSPFDGKDLLLQNQGFFSGLYYDDNGSGSGRTLTDLQNANDMIKLGLAGSIRDYEMETRDGTVKTLAQIRYGTGEDEVDAGYAADPQQVVNYVENHDNQTFFDINTYKLPLTTSMADRVRVQMLGVAVTAFSQGVAYYHAGLEILRSKSMDRDSYNAGDWFNKLDFTYQDNNFGVGAPSVAKNSENYYLIKPRLANVALKPISTDITNAFAVFKDIASIRKSSTLFRMRTAAEIKQRLHFYNTGVSQQAALIAAHIDGTDYAGANFKDVMYFINADKVAKTITIDAEKAKAYALHTAQLNGSDAVVKTATYNNTTGEFTIPARTAAVFTTPTP